MLCSFICASLLLIPFLTSQSNLLIEVPELKTHAYQKTYKCEKCNRHFGQLSSYTRHRRRYKQKSHICGICTMQFHLKQELAEHLISHYNQQEEFDCLVKSCNKKFFALIYLKTHLRDDHQISSENKMPCKSCDRELPSVRSFLIHIQLKHQMPNENESGDTSDTSGVVSGSPEFQLLTSPAPIQDGSTGSSLIHTPHSTATPAPTSSIQTSQVAGVNDVQNPFLICPYCDSVFSNIVNFLIHVFLHTLGEPLKCIICQVSFVNKADFSIHSMVSHKM
ncbi:hypothetical protein CRE_21312 [Caenorhabditis remanei]|uniref:C2H2-type domain-containing protein n=1 Tax=Caenorhabditis remanei TaxID=31234 RepID=E3MUM6_CAERE|nr:hypothetical protein CRE_21312 [Caenorhabditis remanei]